MAERSPRKQRTGVVVSDARDKTVTVEVTMVVRHPKYAKTMKRRRRLQADNPDNDARSGDTVRVMETRPLSATKRWRVVEILERAR
jgi:small subunit ribosomal protein S17